MCYASNTYSEIDGRHSRRLTTREKRSARARASARRDVRREEEAVIKKDFLMALEIDATVIHDDSDQSVAE